MATDAGSIYVRVRADTDQFTRSMAGVNGSMRSVAKQAVLFGGLAGIGAVAYGLTKSIKSAADHQKALMITQAGLKSTGNAANVTAKQITTLADAIEKKTGIDDLAVQSGENMLLTFTNIRNEVGKGNNIFTQATKAVTDLAVRMGNGAASAESMSRASIQVGKALNDPIKGMTALQRVGVQFTDAQKKAIEAMVQSGDTMGAQKLILAELNKEFGGTADAVGKTLPGKLNILKAHLDDVAQKLGEKLLPALTRAVDWVNQHWPEISAVMDTVAGAIGAAVGRVADFVKGHWDTIRNTAVQAFNTIKAVGQGALDFVQSDWGQSLTVTAGLFYGIVKAVTAVIKAVKVLRAISLIGSPLMLALGGLSIALGFVLQDFIDGALKADIYTEALNGVRAAMDKLKGSADTVAQANIDVRRSERDILDARVQAQKSHADYVKVLDKSGKKIAEQSPQYRRWKDDVDRVSEAIIRNRKAHEALGEAEKTRTQALLAGMPTLEELRKKSSDMAQTLEGSKNVWSLYTQNLNAFVKSNRELIPQVAGTVQVLLKQGDSVGAEKAARVAYYAQTVADLATKLGTVPAETRVQATMTEVGFQQFYAHLQDLPNRAGAAGKDTSDRLSSEIRNGVNRVGAAVAGIAPQIAAAGEAAKATAGRVGKDAGSEVARMFGAGAAQVSAAGTRIAQAGINSAEAVFRSLPSKVTTHVGRTVAAISAAESAFRSAGSRVGAAGADEIPKKIQISAPKVTIATGKGAEAIGRAESAFRSQGTKVGKAGGDAIPKPIENAVTKVGAAVARAVGAVAAKVGAASSAGYAVGSAMATGMTSGIMANAGAVAAAAAAMVTNAINAARSAAQAHSDSRVTFQLGKDLVGGVVSAIRQTGGQIATVFAEKITGAISKARTAVTDAQGQFATAFGDLASAAISAFNEKMDAWESPAAKLLAKLDFQEAMDKIQAAFGPQVSTMFGLLTAALEAGNTEMANAISADIIKVINDNVAQAEAALAAAEARLAGLGPGATEEQKAAAQKEVEDAKANLDKQKEARRTALEELDRMLEADHQKKAAIEEQQLKDDLARLERKLQSGKITQEQFNAELLRILGQHGIAAAKVADLAGEGISIATATGLRRGIPKVDAAVGAVIAALNKLDAVSKTITVKVKVDVDTSSPSAIAGKAAGGIVKATPGGMYRVAEAGKPEAVLPLDNAKDARFWTVLGQALAYKGVPGYQDGGIAGDGSSGGMGGYVWGSTKVAREILNNRLRPGTYTMEEIAALYRALHGLWKYWSEYPGRLLEQMKFSKNWLLQQFPDVKIEDAWMQAMIEWSDPTPFGDAIQRARGGDITLMRGTFGQWWVDQPGEFELPQELEKVAAANEWGLGTTGGGVVPGGPAGGAAAQSAEDLAKKLGGQLGMQKGGLVKGSPYGTWALLGERGKDELVVPISRWQQGLRPLGKVLEFPVEDADRVKRVIELLKELGAREAQAGGSFRMSDAQYQAMQMVDWEERILRAIEGLGGRGDGLGSGRPAPRQPIQITTVIELDGQKVAESTTDYQIRQARQGKNGPWSLGAKAGTGGGGTFGGGN